MFVVTIMSEIKMFRLVQSFHQNLGLYSPQSSRIHISKLRVLLLPACIASGLTSMLGFLIFEAKTIQVHSFYFYVHFFDTFIQMEVFLILGIRGGFLCNFRVDDRSFGFCNNDSNVSTNPKTDQKL